MTDTWNPASIAEANGRTAQDFVVSRKIGSGIGSGRVTRAGLQHPGRVQEDSDHGRLRGGIGLAEFAAKHAASCQSRGGRRNGGAGDQPFINVAYAASMFAAQQPPTPLKPRIARRGRRLDVA